jgi:chitodextrinase
MIRPKTIGFLVAVSIFFSLVSSCHAAEPFTISPTAPSAVSPSATATQYPKDLSISEDDVRFSDSNPILGKAIKVYATVHNNSEQDLSGVVKFFDEKTKAYIGTDEPVSILRGKTDDVFFDWTPDSLGSHAIAVRVDPSDLQGDNPANNKVTKTVFVDSDSNQNGIPDRLEPKPTVKPNPFPTPSTSSAQAKAETAPSTAATNPTSTALATAPLPVIEVSDPQALTGKSITFNGLKTKDPTGSLRRYDWDFGDGTQTSGLIVEHAFWNPGQYRVTLKTTDAQGNSQHQQTNIAVARDWLPLILVGVTFLLLLMLLGMAIPSSRFHYKKMLRNPSATPPKAHKK